ncbi:MAG: helix-turn-helix domain-containing protein [Candidatus Merdivicinus sp.]|jgi:AraC-like DNA-binding protein
MHLITLQQLRTADVSFYRLTSLRYFWGPGSVDRFVDRTRVDNLLVYLIRGERSYTRGDGDAGEFLKIQNGDILFAPTGCNYVSTLRLREGEHVSEGIFVTFSIRDENGGEVCPGEGAVWMAHDTDGHYYRLFEELLEAVMRGSGGNLSAKALLSRLLQELLAHVRLQDSFGPDLEAIYPAVVRIEHHPQEAVSVPELARLCFLSESTFRKKFEQYTHLSPIQYRNHIRLQKAIELLRNGIYTVEETAAAMGYHDASHLSNAVKKSTGLTPREIAGGAKIPEHAFPDLDGPRSEASRR